MGNVQIQIVDADNGIEGVIDLIKSDNFPLSLTIKNNDIANLNTRSGLFSTSFDIPRTKANNKLLGSLYYSQVKNTKEYFLKKDAIILKDGNVFQRGKLRIEQISNDGYRAVFLGNNSEWITLLKETYLSDIGYTSVITIDDTISNSFTNTYTDEYVMNFIDRGINRTFANRINAGIAFDDVVHFEEFNADLFIHKMINMSLNSIGYTFHSDFFDNFGTKLIYSEISDNYKKQDTIDNYLETTVSVDSTASVQSHYNGSPISEVNGRFGVLPFNNVIEDENSNYNNTTYTTTVSREGYYSIEIDIEIEIDSLSTILNADNYIFRVAIIKDGISGLYDLQVNNITQLPNTDDHIGSIPYTGDIDIFPSTGTFEIKATVTAYFLENEEYRFGMVVERIDTQAFSPSITIGYTIKSGTSLKITELDGLVRNNTFNLTDVVDSSKYSIASILSDLTKLFNLQWRTDNKIKKVYCEPNDSFYDSIADAKDWTNLIDTSKYSLTPISNKYKRTLALKYAIDSGDGVVSKINKNGDNVGSYSHDLGASFKDGTNTVQLQVFAASLTEKLTRFYNTTTTAKLWHNHTDEQDEFFKGFRPRILEYEAVALNSQIRRESQTAEKELSSFVENTPPAATSTNLDFSTQNGVDGLFVKHYLQTFAKIADGFILKIKARLPYGVKETDVLFFAAPYDIKGYWTISKISNIKPLDDGLVTLELLEYKNIVPPIEQPTRPIIFLVGESTLSNIDPIQTK